MTHTFAYRCGGSDGITAKELTLTGVPSSRLIPWLSSQKDTCRLAGEVDPLGSDCQADVSVTGVANSVIWADVFIFALMAYYRAILAINEVLKCPSGKDF
jgi:hypothetical protein